MRSATRFCCGSTALFIVLTMLCPAAIADTTTCAGAYFGAASPMNIARMGHFTAVLPGGNAMVFGGHGTNFVSLSTSEVYNATANSFTTIAMSYTHDSPIFTRLADGRFLLAGGSSDLGVPAYATAEIYNPVTNTFTPTAGPLQKFRAGGGAAPLSNGKVLIAGAWYNHNDAYNYGEIFDPSTGLFSLTGTLNASRSHPIVIPTSDGNALVFGGYGVTGGWGPQNVEQYNTATNTFTVVRTSLFAGDTGWQAYGTDSYHRTIQEQQMKTGEYLLMAYKANLGLALFTVNPTTKVFSRITTTPLLPTNASIWAPVVDTAHNAAYFVAQPTDTTLAFKAGIFSVSLLNWHLTPTADWYSLPSNLYLGGLGLTVLGNGKLLIAGCNSQTGYYTNFSPTTNAFLAVPCTPNNGVVTVPRLSSKALPMLNGSTLIAQANGKLFLRIINIRGELVGDFAIAAHNGQRIDIASYCGLAKGCYAVKIRLNGIEQSGIISAVK
jgi:hypothetical protein